MSEQQQQDYSFLRAGQGSRLDEETISPAQEEMTKTLMSMCVALVSRAGTSAALYAKHAKRSSTHAQDVTMGLQYQAKTFFDQVEDEELQAAREDVDAAFRSTTPSVSDDEEEEESEEEEDKEEAWSRSTCSCTTCTEVNAAHDTWDSWNPQDEVLAYLKSTTDKYIEMQKISSL